MVLSNYKYDINEFKSWLTQDQIMELLTDLGGEPILKNDNMIDETEISDSQKKKIINKR